MQNFAKLTHLQQNYVQMPYTDFHHNRTINVYSKRRVKQYLYRPWEFQEVEVLIFQDNRHMKVVRLSALRTGRLYSRDNKAGTHLSEVQSTPVP
jgi:hypothetical protein